MEPTVQGPTAYPRGASIVSLIGGAIIVIGGALFLGVALFVIPHLDLSGMTVPQGINRTALPALISGVLGVMGAFGLVSGSVVLVSSIMILAKIGSRRTWGILILVFSILSFVGLGGFVIGAILGIAGGILVLRWKPPAASA